MHPALRCRHRNGCIPFCSSLALRFSFQCVRLMAMAIVVQQYGGRSVADLQKLRLVAERVVRTKKAGHGVVVVVSAMGDTTDELLGMAKQISGTPDRRELDMLLT